MSMISLSLPEQEDYVSREQFNTICSNISFAGHSNKTIAVTSCKSGDGKSYVSVRTAVNFAQRGKRVLLIDADLRQSCMAQRFSFQCDKEEMVGLAHYLAGVSALQEVVYKTNYQNLFLIPAGRHVVNPLQLLTTLYFQKMIQQLEKQCDYIIIDTPSMGLVIDAVEIARYTHGVIFVVNYNTTHRRELREAKNALDKAEVPILGCVLNRVTSDVSVDELLEDGERTNRQKEKKKRSWRIVFLILEIMLLMVLVPAIALMVSLIVKYRTVSYEYQKPVIREEEYVMPEYPEVIVDTDGVWVEGMDVEPTYLTNAPDREEAVIKPEEPEQVSEPVMQMKKQESAKTEETAPRQREMPKTETESQPKQEALPNIVNTPSRTNAGSYPADTIFSNSPDAVSVYADVPIYQVARKNSDVQNILVLGTDTRDATIDRGRSDVMIVVSYNKKSGTIKLTSLLRDSLVPVEGHDWNRINTAYFFGGVGLAVNTVNQLYGLDIQDFVVIDFDGVKAFFDYIGGVDVYLTQAEVDYYGWKDMKEGVNHLNADQALSHMRNRHLDSDFGRTRRQRDVIAAVLEAVSQEPLTKIYDIVDYSFSLIKTNIPATSMAMLAAAVHTNVSNLTIETQNVPYTDAYQNAWYNGMAILSFDIEAAAKRLQRFIYS